MSAREGLSEARIVLRDYSVGNRKTTCPQCSHKRKHKSDPCLSVTIGTDDEAVWHCHNCGWSGGSSSHQHQQAQAKPTSRRQSSRDWRTKFTSDRKW